MSEYRDEDRELDKPAQDSPEKEPRGGMVEEGRRLFGDRDPRGKGIVERGEGIFGKRRPK